MAEDQTKTNMTFSWALEFVVNYKRQILVCLTIITSVILLWVFREHLSGLASVLWPILMGATIIGFRQELSNLLKRIKSLGKAGMEFRDEQIAAQIVAVPVSDALRDVAPDERHSATITSKVEATRIELNARIPEDQVKREHLLMLRLAEAQQARDFYYIWLQIFLSQLDALVKMASEFGAVDLSEFFELHLSRVESLPNPPTVKVSFDGWVSYLVRMQLITVNQTFGTITPFGREFLAFTTATNLPRFHVL